VRLALRQRLQQRHERPPPQVAIREVEILI
jgi:hypothetical protein